MQSIIATFTHFLDPANMILLKNCDIKLDYNPATDILEIEYPDMYSYQLSEINYNMGLMVASIKNYDIKKLLFDSSKTVIQVSEHEYSEVMDELLLLLAETRLQKVARIALSDKARERIEHYKVVEQEKLLKLPFSIETFKNRSDAKAWLSSSLN